MNVSPSGASATGLRGDARGDLRDARVLVVGAGGLGCPALLALAHAGVGTIGIADQDDVDASNLHRQILFDEDDIGRDKCAVAAGAIVREFPSIRVCVHTTRILPSNALELVSAYDLVVEGSDNFPTKFLVADACVLAAKPVVHGAAIRWHGTAFSVGAHGRPCYRCVFEDIPWEAAESCATAGVMGPVVGVVGALIADLALSSLASTTETASSVAAPRHAHGTLVSFDGKTNALRRRILSPRARCALCGDQKTITGIDQKRYSRSESQVA